MIAVLVMVVALSGGGMSAYVLGKPMGDGACRTARDAAAAAYLSPHNMGRLGQDGISGVVFRCVVIAGRWSAP